VSVLRIAVAQQDFSVGDLVGNTEKIVQAAQAAHRDGAHLLLTPELSLCGYPPEDLLLQPSFLQACEQALQHLLQRLAVFPGLYVVVGYPAQIHEQLFNRAIVVCDGEIQGHYDKQCLPNHGVFDERRYFHQGEHALVLNIQACRVAILICEDVWHQQPSAQAVAQGAELIVVLNASPYHQGKPETREAMVCQRALETQVPYVYCNLVGAQDELVFDGGSFMVDRHSQVIQRLPLFVERLAYFVYDSEQGGIPGPIEAFAVAEAQIYRALKLGLRDYVHKNQFQGVILGLSGGVDSALVLALACDALGADKVSAVMMPSCYTAEISLVDARAIASNLGVRYTEIPIMPMVEALGHSLQPHFVGHAADTTEENIQARVRGTLLMALANKHRSLVLTTGNKSELAVGYCTLYGDMAGGFAVIKDLLKTWVYRLCHWRNSQSAVIPERILTRAPSAELKPNQTDQDSLPSYSVLDEILFAYIEEKQSISQLIDKGYPPDIVERVISLIKISEHKRRQCAIGPRVTACAFGRDWRYPISNLS
jgi:NAD+ synthase (glutamine-hydrolysing)